MWNAIDLFYIDTVKFTHLKLISWADVTVICFTSSKTEVIIFINDKLSYIVVHICQRLLIHKNGKT